MFYNTASQSILSLAATALNITELYKPSLSSRAEIFLPSDANYTQSVTQRWSSHEEPSYVGAIKPATESDIQNIVKISSANRVPFLATGGGCSATTSVGALHDGLHVDLSNFDSIYFDTEKGLLTVGGAARFEQITNLLYDARRQFQIGTATCVGIIGATIGAGVGPAQGELGLMADLLESARLVTAFGSIITVSKTENEDLFWAIRGAGANFGIITSATYRVPDAINNGQVLNADFLFPARANQSIWDIMNSYDDELPSQLALNFAVSFNQSIDELVFIINAQYFGPTEDGMVYLEALFALDPIATSNQVVPWNQLIETSYFGVDTAACKMGHYINMYSIGINQTDTGTFESFFTELRDFSRRHPEIHTNFVTHRFPTQAVRAVPDAETAYPHRDLKMHVQLESLYADPALDGTVDSFLQSARTKFQHTDGFLAGPATHVNFAHGDEGPEVWYSARKLANLTRLKQKWDPDQLFSWSNPVPLHWP